MLTQAKSKSVPSDQDTEDANTLSYPKKLQGPLQSLPEIAFAGESNVGKSSLLQALLDEGTEDPRLVKTSRRAVCLSITIRMSI